MIADHYGGADLAREDDDFVLGTVLQDRGNGTADMA